MRGYIEPSDALSDVCPGDRKRCTWWRTEQLQRLGMGAIHTKRWCLRGQDPRRLCLGLVFLEVC